MRPLRPCPPIPFVAGLRRGGVALLFKFDVTIYFILIA